MAITRLTSSALPGQRVSTAPATLVAEPPPSPPPSVDNDFSALFGFSGGNPFIEDDRDRAKKVWLRREDEEIMIIISCL